MSPTVRRTAVSLTSAASLVAATLVISSAASPSVASEPESSTLSIPGTAGESVTATYKGVSPAGAITGLSCPRDGGPLVDQHELVLEGAEDATATIEFAIAWMPADNNLRLTVYDGDGGFVGSSNSNEPMETVRVDELPPGTYTAVTCSANSQDDQPYDGTITVTSTAPLPDPGPTVDTGLEFSPSLVTDPQRSQGESAAFADDSGVLYSCGTNGASNGTDHGSVSVDGGETWRPLGTPPIGETGTVQGGGDCAIGTGQDLNEDGNRQLAFIGLGPLTGFSTFTSPDNGRTLQRSPDQNGLEKFNQTSLVDRQWLAFTDDKTVFLNYNGILSPDAILRGAFAEQVVQKSTDGGLTYGPQQVAATDGNRIGQLRVIKEGVVPGIDPSKDVVYFPYSSGTTVKLAMSLDGGDTFSQCLAVDAGIDPTAGFVTADHDSAGNIYVTYSEKGGGRDTYLVALKADGVKDCKGPNPVEDSEMNNVDPGFTDKIRINREGIETTVMPWVAAGGEAGRVAVSYYGTPSIGNPDSGAFKATWNVYVNQTLDAFAAEPTLDQVKATTHPNHYDSICLGGLGCDIPNLSGETGDRALVDYFTMDFDPVTGRLLVVYNQAAKIAGEAEGNIAAPVSLVQRAGPSNSGGTVEGQPEVVRTGSADKPGDAIPRWTTDDGLAGSPTVGAGGDENQAALDLLDVQVTSETDPETGFAVADGGFNVVMTYEDLSPAALNAALASGPGSSLIYLFRFFDGYQPGGATAHYEPAAGGWRFGYDDYQTTIRNPQGNVQTYEGRTPIEGAVDEEAGTITLSVPRELVEALEGPAGPDERPEEVTATEGSRIYDASAWSFINPLPTSEAEQSFLFQSDNSAAFDFLLPGLRARDISDACPPDRVPRDSREDDDGSVHEFAIDCMVFYDIARGTTLRLYDPSAPVDRAQMASFIARLIERSGGELPADAPNAFTDDNGFTPHEENINKLAAVKIIDGKGGGRYDPTGTVSRAQMAKFLVNAYQFRSGNELDGSMDFFPDDNDDLLEEFINKAAFAGFTDGRDGRYEPAQPVRRDQMASFLARALDLLVQEGTAKAKGAEQA